MTDRKPNCGRLPLTAFVAAGLTALTLAACGGDDETTTSSVTTSSTTSTVPTGATGADDSAATATAPGGSAKDVTAEITSCLEDAGHSVIENPGSIADSQYFLVVNAGGIGVITVFDDSADAEAGLEAVDKDQKSTGRVSEVAGQTVISYFPSDQSLAPSPEELADLEECTGAA